MMIFFNFDNFLKKKERKKKKAVLLSLGSAYMGKVWI